tara:strand:- start:872 stop:2062 length:1191 start_codon:yes stop_codon:yes gene_type:complete
MLDLAAFDKFNNHFLIPEGPMKSILLFDGIFQYGVVNEFLNEMIQTLPELGLNPIRVNLAANELNKLESVDFDQVACAICFNGIGSALDYQGESFFKKTNIPVLHILVDHPAFHIDRLTTLSNQAVSCVDQTHVEFLKGIGCPQAFLLLHGGPSEATFVEKNRPIEILFPASFSQELLDGNHWEQKYGDLAKVLYDLKNEALLNPLDGLEERILEHSLAVNLVGETNVSNVYMEIVKDLNLHFRHKARLEILEAMDKSGQQVHLCGLGWEAHKFKNHKYLGQCNFEKTQEHMKNSKVLLDSSPFHPVGLHERFLYGSMCGAAVITDHNPVKSQIFEHKVDAFLYNTENLVSLGDSINDYLSNDSWIDVALNGQTKVKENHTWKHRTQAVVEAFNLR